MAERKAVNKYYPPDWTPDKGSINKYVGQHPLRERAKKLGQGILVIRFELPYNIWCGGCGNHVGMGVRYNAEKKKVGNYYSTPIYRFRMKCHLCDNYFEIETDPKNCDYVVVSGARRKNETWEPSATETVETTDKEDAKRMAIDAMFKLEHGVEDVQKSKKVAPVIHQLQEVQSVWKDDYAANKMLRKKFRDEKKHIADVKRADDELRKRASLDIALVPEEAEDVQRAKKIRFYKTGFDAHKRNKRREIEGRSWFSETSTNPLATKLPSLLSNRKRRTNTEDDKNDWKKSVLVKSPSADKKCDKTLGEIEGEIPRMSNDDNNEGTAHREGQLVQEDYSLKHGETADSQSNNGTNYNASTDENVLTPDTPFVSDSSSTLVTRTEHNTEKGRSSRDVYEQTSLTHDDKTVLSRISTLNKEGPSTLVSSLYSSASSDDDSES